VDANIAGNVRRAAGAANAARAYGSGEKSTLAELAAQVRVSNNQTPPQ